MNKKYIYCGFIDFWPNFNKLNYLNILNNIINNSEYEFKLSNDNNKPNLIFGSVFGNKKYNYNIPCISINTENILNNKNYYNNIINSTYIIGNYKNANCYFNFLFNIYCEHLININNDIINIENKTNRKFCSFVVSNANCQDRLNIFKTLNAYKKIDSAGQVFNNIKIGNTRKDKVEFLSKYKFNICFENSFNNPYYITEKLRDAIFANTLPIYKGGDIELTNFINPKCIINCNNKSIEYITDLIKEIDNNDDMYLEYFKENIFLNKNYFDDEYNKFKEFLINILNNL